MINRIEKVVRRGKAGDAVEVKVSFTREQYKAIVEKCGDFRLTPEEFGKAAMLGHLESDEDVWLVLLYEANEDRDTGVHPKWTDYLESLEQDAARDQANLEAVANLKATA
jgi:hypothetical protein